MRTTNPITIYAGERKEIHGLTKIKHGGYSVNCMSEPAIGHSLPTDLEEDLGNLNQPNSNPQYSKSQTKSSEGSNKPNSEEEDDASWILKLTDLSGLEDWPEHLQTEAKEMLKRNAKTFSKNYLDMDRTNLVNIISNLQTHYLSKKHTGEYLLKCMMKSRHISKKC